MDHNHAVASLPPDKIAAIEQALLATFGTTELDAITPLTGGLSSAKLFRIDVQGQSYAMRLMLQTDPLRDPQRLFTCMQLAADAGVAPRVYYADVASALSITDYVHARPLTGQLADRTAFLTQLAQTIKTIHATPLFPPLVNFMDGVDGFIANFQAAQRLPAAATAEHLRLYAQIQQHYPRHDPDLVSSHNDLNYNNILFDGTQFWIIDWEAAFRNDRYVDLANVANGLVNDSAQEDVLLAAYFGDTLDDYRRARFFLMRQTCRFFYAMIMFNMLDARLPKGEMFDANMATPSAAELHQRIGSGTVQLSSDEGQLLFAKVMLNEALAAMQSPRFEQSLALIRANG